MKWVLRQTDILDEPADVLVCSANPYLNLSGGVGGAFLLRYGDEMQQELHSYLSQNNMRYVERGQVVPMPPCGSPYKAVFHAVGVDAFYDSSAEVVTTVTQKALRMADELRASKVALAAIATGYGRLSLEEFAAGIRPLMDLPYPNLTETVVCLRKQDDIDTLSEIFASFKSEDAN